MMLILRILIEIAKLRILYYGHYLEVVNNSTVAGRVSDGDN